MAQNEFDTIVKDKQQIDIKLFKPKILCCFDSVCNPDGTSKTRYCKSWPKQNLVSVMYYAFTSTENKKNVSSGKKMRKSLETLTNITKKLSKRFQSQS